MWETEASGFWAFIKEILSIVIISLVIVIPIRYYLAQPFRVKGQSMEPNFLNGEYLIINEIGYRLNSPQRGDVIVFKYPRDPSEYFIKRIIGLPGEKVEVSEGQVVVYNSENPKGHVLDESGYLPAYIETKGELVTSLGNSEYFVLGDNREASSDSRFWGPLPREFIIGKAWVRAFPFTRFTVFSAADYGAESGITMPQHAARHPAAL